MASLESRMETIAQRVRDHAGTIDTEEAAKTSLILPFLQALGYDVFDPGEVIPEYAADTHGKKGEKVDYAIKLDGGVTLLIECKSLTTELEAKHLSQLYRYFSVTNAKFSVLTNGRLFQFHSDLQEQNKLDARPFFTFDILDYGAASLAELKKFEKQSFDVDKILATAERLKYVSAVKTVLTREMETPSADFVKLVASEVYDGRVTSQVRDTVGAAIRSAYREIILDSVQSRLSSALDDTAEAEPEEAASEIVTTLEEKEGMLTIRAVVRDLIDVTRVDLRDAKTYCAVLVDDNNRKPLARMHFNRNQWYLGLFDTGSEERVKIDGLDEIYAHAERLRETARKYYAH